MKYQPVIGLEIHVELNTKTKMFCRCSTKYFGEEPNTHTCPTCLGLPGALPYPNNQAIEDCAKIALALGCEITNFSYFERKNYFYPDLPKGYQISQYVGPFGHDGYLDIKSEVRNTKFETNSKSKISNSKRIRIRRVHMEEDTGKIIHQEVEGEKVSLLDFNRSGIPLVEIVTEPDITSGEEAKAFLTKLQRIIKYLGVSDADMEKGNMRLEPNISLLEISNSRPERSRRVKFRAAGIVSGDARPISNDKLPSYKVEVKNINSFRFVERAIEFEQKRQTEILERGEIPVQETRGWNETKNQTVSQRIKEEAHDYRYFPEPDIPPILLEQSVIDKLKHEIPELPDEKTKRFVKEYGLSEYNTQILTREKTTADYFETAVKEGQKFKIESKHIANEIINKKIDINQVLPAQLISQIREQKSNIQEKLTDEDKKIINDVICENDKAAQDYKNGKIQVLGFLIGMVNRKLQGKKINTNIIKQELENLLK